MADTRRITGDRLDDADIPLQIRRELMACATANGRISYYYLCDIFRAGSASGGELDADYYGDVGTEREWRQCRWCGGYADGPIGSKPATYLLKDGVPCPVGRVR